MTRLRLRSTLASSVSSPQEKTSTGVRLDGRRLSKSQQTGSSPESLRRPFRARRPETKTDLRVLDFDIETRLVGFAEFGPFKPKGMEPITVACSWSGSGVVDSILIGQSQDIPHMMEWFLEFWEKADAVTGHYIWNFDLPVLNGALMEWHVGPLLSPKLVIDTKRHHRKVGGISLSQENLGIYHRLDRQKYHMADADWRRSTRLTPGGQRKSRIRAEHDVLQHDQLRLEMHREGMLKPWEMWKH